VFEGPDAGKYRYPHINYAVLEVHLANKKDYVWKILRSMVDEQSKIS